MGTQIATQMPGQLPLPIATQMHPFKVAALARRIEPGWQAGAGCLGAKDPDAWFPHEQTPLVDLAEPLAVCAGCPVRLSCLAAGVLDNEHGLWGGVTETARRDARADLAAGAQVDDVLDELLDTDTDTDTDDGRSAA